MVLTRSGLTQKQCCSMRMEKYHTVFRTLPQKVDTGRKGDGNGGSWDIRGKGTWWSTCSLPKAIPLLEII